MCMKKIVTHFTISNANECNFPTKINVVKVQPLMTLKQLTLYNFACGCCLFLRNMSKEKFNGQRRSVLMKINEIPILSK